MSTPLTDKEEFTLYSGRSPVEVVLSSFARDLEEKLTRKSFQCVGLEAEVSGLRADIDSLKEVIQGVHDSITRLTPASLNMEYEDYVTRFGCGQEHAKSKGLLETISKLKSCIQNTPQK